MPSKVITLIFVVTLFTGCVSEGQPVQTVVSDPFYIFMPIIIASQNKPLFCVENEDADFDADLSARYHGECLKASIHWGLVERDGWGYVERKIGSFDGSLFLSIKGAPSWVTLAETCRPIPRQAWPGFVGFVEDVLERYPHTIMVEFGNEPDTDSSFAEYYFGCWGNSYSDGQFYGEFVNYIYDQLQPLFPDIKFLGGAFMNARSEFAAGALSVMQADGVSFHNYPWCGEESHYPELLAALHERTTLPLYFSETGLLYKDAEAAQCEMEQAEYVAELFDYTGVEAVVYYTLGCRSWDWNNSSIWGESCRRKPAVSAYETKLGMDKDEDFR